MKLTRRAFHRLFLASLGGFALPTLATELVAERDYLPIVPPQPSEVPGKIEVLEFFSYACPFCQNFHPLVKAWAGRQHEDVVVRAVPVTFGRASWAALARLHYALELTGDLERVGPAAFRAIHQERIRLFTERAITAWVAEQGVDPDRFATAYNAFSVNVKVSRSDHLVRTHQVQAVPQLTVGGRYVVTGGSTFEERLAIADQLVERIRGG